MTDSLLLTAVPVRTFAGGAGLTNASGFLFARDDRLYLITCRHVLFDDASEHRPDRIEIEMHEDAANMADTVRLSIPLYSDGRRVWRQAADGGGSVDVAALEVDRAALPPSAVYRAFSPDHLPYQEGSGREGSGQVGSGQEAETLVEIGTPLLIVGFPLGFHDQLHRLPVARHAIVATSFGLRFQGLGYFLTDGRTHRGSSGAPVVMRAPGSDAALPWSLLGIHAARLDVGTRDLAADEALGLNCAWYADVLMALTTREGPSAVPARG